MESLRRLFGVVSVFSAGLLASAVMWAAPPAQARTPIRIDSAVQGQVVEAAGSPDRAELVTFGADLPSSLLRVAPDQEVRIAGWPVAPEERADVLLTRHEVYAPDARIWHVDEGRLAEVPRSKLAFYWGQAEDDEETWAFLSLDPESGQIEGFASKAGAVYNLRPLSAVQKVAAGDRQHVIAPSAFFHDELAKAGQKPNWGCGQGQQEILPFLAEKAQAPADEPVEPIFAAAITSLHTATLAVDTDTEFMSVKFANNTTTASNYIASLIASMNVMYERDLKIRLLQGTTFLRTGSDPYVQPPDGNGFVTNAQLSELASNWTTNHSGVARALVMMLSGKSPFSNQAAGRASLNVLCSTASGYSFSMVFTFAANTATFDSSLVGHEIGHNFGSHHTHCYSPPIDTCFSGECYVGPTSCPAPATMSGIPNVRGTVMSYCHLLGGCAAAEVFHQRTIDLLNPLIESRVNTCIFPVDGPPTIAAVLPNSGTTAGGTPVVITGTNFRAGATVAFGGTAASGVIVVNPTVITAITPARSTGAVGVTVTNTDATNATKANAYFYAPPAAALSFYTLSPCRILDTRNANGPLGGPVLSAGQQRTFTATGACGVPAGAKALSANMTVATPSAAGLLSLYPGNAFPLGTSSISFRAGQTIANNATLMLSTSGTGTFGVENATAGVTHFILDVNGYYQ